MVLRRVVLVKKGGCANVVTTVDTRLVEVTMTAKRRLPDLLVTLVARPAVRNVAGRGTAARRSW